MKTYVEDFKNKIESNMIDTQYNFKVKVKDMNGVVNITWFDKELEKNGPAKNVTGRRGKSPVDKEEWITEDGEETEEESEKRDAALLNQEKNYKKVNARRRKRVFEYSLCNKWTSFWTFTFKDDVRDVEEANAYYKKFIKRLKRFMERMGMEEELKYLTVIEFQDKNREGVIHYHSLLNVPYLPQILMQKMWEGYTVREAEKSSYNRLNKSQKARWDNAVEEIKKEGSTFTTIVVNNRTLLFTTWNGKTKIMILSGEQNSGGFVYVNRITHVRNIGKYITKYMSKTNGDVRLKGKKAFLVSNNLEKAKEITEPTLVHEFLVNNGIADKKPIATFEGEIEDINNGFVWAQYEIKEKMNKNIPCRAGV